MKQSLYKQFISIILSVSMVGTSVPANALKHSFLAPPGEKEFVKLGVTFDEITTKEGLPKEQRQKRTITWETATNNMKSGIQDPLTNMPVLFSIIFASSLVIIIFGDWIKELPLLVRFFLSPIHGVSFSISVSIVNYITQSSFWYIRLFHYRKLSFIQKRIFIFIFRLLQIFNISLIGSLFIIIVLYFCGVNLPVFLTPSFLFLIASFFFYCGDYSFFYL